MVSFERINVLYIIKSRFAQFTLVEQLNNLITQKTDSLALNIHLPALNTCS